MKANFYKYENSTFADIQLTIFQYKFSLTTIHSVKPREFLQGFLDLLNLDLWTKTQLTMIHNWLENILRKLIEFLRIDERVDYNVTRTSLLHIIIMIIALIQFYGNHAYYWH